MRINFKSLFVTIALTLSGTAAMAYISEGNWTNGRDYYYVNNNYAYCSTGYKHNARYLTWSQEQELRSYRYDGQCEAYDKGGKNYRGRSYYFNGEGAYCQYYSYKPHSPEMSDYQANQLFRTNRFDGWCQE